jgi:hypothetical protein
VLQAVTAAVRSIIGGEVGLDEPLMASGVDSLGATELPRRDFLARVRALTRAGG